MRSEEEFAQHYAKARGIDLADARELAAAFMLTVECGWDELAADDAMALHRGLVLADCQHLNARLPGLNLNPVAYHDETRVQTTEAVDRFKDLLDKSKKPDAS